MCKRYRHNDTKHSDGEYDEAVECIVIEIMQQIHKRVKSEGHKRNHRGEKL